ncbi:MAG TPA: hopanoid-associated sugar epimerase [Caulobacteraceae bacterium]|nr:hopanoid-associated sugar epimerase [Caulobacteraceae bacterium]
MPDIAAVTGAAGFVGSAVVRDLIGRGIGVRALARGAAPRPNLQGLDCQVAEADITDRGAVERAFAGARFVFHVAADYRLWARHPSEIFRANVEGTRIVMEAALAQGVERIIHTSSVATLRCSPGAAADETAPLAPDEAVGAYKQSKVMGERLVEAMAAERGLPAVIVNPSTPIGPRDVRPTPTGRIITEAAAGRIPAFVDTGLNLVHVDDVAAGHWLALEKGVVGERYILGGDDVTLRALLAEIAALSGRRAPTLSLPRAPLFPLALAAEGLAHLTGAEPFVTRDALKMAAHHMYFSSAKAKAQLGYAPRPHGEALTDALTWFRKAGYVH